MVRILFCIVATSFLLSHFESVVSATPFPITGDIYNAENELTAHAQVYPRYVEITDLSGKKLGRVGIMVEEGIAKLFLVKQDKRHSLIGYSGPSDHPNKGILYNTSDKLAGYYFWTPTWSFIFDNQNKRVGKVKCIAWPRVCAAGVGGFLLKFFDPNQ